MQWLAYIDTYGCQMNPVELPKRAPGRFVVILCRKLGKLAAWGCSLTLNHKPQIPLTFLTRSWYFRTRQAAVRLLMFQTGLFRRLLG